MNRRNRFINAESKEFPSKIAVHSNVWEEPDMSILELIGNTPLVKIPNPNGSDKVRILGKLEGNNPGGSIKDRIAVYMI